jgi:hypothetical protein
LSVVGGGTGYLSHVIFYVGVPDVEGPAGNDYGGGPART